MKSNFTFTTLRVIPIWIFNNYVVINLISTTVSIYNNYSETSIAIDFLIYPYFMPLFMLTISWFLWFKANVLCNKLITTVVNESKIEVLNTRAGLLFKLDFIIIKNKYINSLCETILKPSPSIDKYKRLLLLALVMFSPGLIPVLIF